MILSLIGFIGFALTIILLFVFAKLSDDDCYVIFKIGKRKIMIEEFTAIFIDAIIGLVFFLFAVCCACEIIGAHVGVDAKIYESQIQYDSLVRRYNIVNSEYEDVSRSDVIRDVADWNKEVYHEKYWANNSWTSWFYDRDYVESLKYIDLNEVVIDPNRITEEECDALIEIIRRET